MVLFWRQRAGSESCKCTRRIVRFVEIDHHAVIFGILGHQEPAGGIAAVAAAQILEQDVKLAAGQAEGVQCVSPAIQLEF